MVSHKTDCPAVWNNESKPKALELRYSRQSSPPQGLSIMVLFAFFVCQSSPKPRRELKIIPKASVLPWGFHGCRFVYSYVPHILKNISIWAYYFLITNRLTANKNFYFKNWFNSLVVGVRYCLGCRNGLVSPFCLLFLYFLLDWLSR